MLYFNEVKVRSFFRTAFKAAFAGFLGIATSLGVDTLWEMWGLYDQWFSGLSALAGIYVLVAVWRGGHLVLYPDNQKRL